MRAAFVLGIGRIGVPGGNLWFGHISTVVLNKLLHRVPLPAGEKSPRVPAERFSEVSCKSPHVTRLNVSLKVCFTFELFFLKSWHKISLVRCSMILSDGFFLSPDPWPHSQG